MREETLKSGLFFFKERVNKRKMNTMKQVLFWAHMLDESMLTEGNQAVIADIESSFGDWIWQEGANFSPNNLHLKQMFRIINKHIFGGELDDNVKKIVKDENSLRGPERGAMAMFEFGMIHGIGEEYLAVVKHNQKDNFFIVFNSMIHEMIHMYDYRFGPMGKQFQKWKACGCFNWNYPHPRHRYDAVGIRDARRSHLADVDMDPDQLPDELRSELDKVPRIPAQAHPRQYQFPAKPGLVMTPRGPAPFPKPLPMKYRMDQLDGFYDVHGSFFQQLADHANRLGFSIDDVFYPNKKYAMQRIDEDPDETPEDLRYLEGEAIKEVFDRIEDPGKKLDFKDENNWIISLV